MKIGYIIVVVILYIIAYKQTKEIMERYAQLPADKQTIAKEFMASLVYIIPQWAIIVYLIWYIIKR
jgi:hypothetical protein